MKPRTLFAGMLAASLLISAAPALSAQTKDPKMAEQEKQMAEAKKQLAEAKRQLAEASKKYAELSMKMSKEQGGKKIHTFVYVNEDRPRLGVLVNTDNRPDTDSKGALLEGVTPGSPADEAGLKAKDIITKFNGEKLTGPYEDADEDESAPGLKFIDLAGRMKKGDKVTLEYLRGKETRTTTVTPRVIENKEWDVISPEWTPDVPDFEVEIPDIPEIPDLPESFYLYNMPRQWLDMELVTLTPELGQYFNATEGLLVVSAPKDSTLKLKAGDVILRIGDHKVTTPSQAYRILRNYEVGETATFEIMRKQNRESISVTVPEAPKSKVRHEQHRSPKAPAPPEAPAPPAAPAPPSGSGRNEATA